MDLVDWYAQMAREDEMQVATVPATASQYATPIEHLLPLTKGIDSPPQYC